MDILVYLKKNNKYKVENKEINDQIKEFVKDLKDSRFNFITVKFRVTTLIQTIMIKQYIKHKRTTITQIENGNTRNERFFSSHHYRTETTHHLNGSVKTISHFYKNKYHGKQVEFYDNDVMKSCRFYFHGKKSRFYKEYYPSGKLKVRVGYNKKGKKSGNAIKFYENEILKDIL